MYGLLSRSALALGTFLFAACDFGEVTTYELEGPSAVDFELRALTSDTAVAQALGWDGVAIPAAHVRLELENDDGVSWSAEASTDVEGRVVFEAVPVGTHLVSIVRDLTAEERDAAADEGALTLRTEARLRVSSTSPSAEIVVPAGTRRALVISEFAFNSHLSANGVGIYNFGGYIELYNNTDTTIYLDGKIVGSGFDVLLHMPPDQGCDDYAPLRLDSRGVWARVWERFPGSGSDHPLAAGETVVIATDAIDHRPFAPLAPDLRTADFEFRGPSDVDNPAVADMIPDGLHPHPLNRGLLFNTGRGVAFVAEPVVTGDLEQMPFLFNRTWARVPTEALLDMVVVYETDPLTPQWPLCPEVSHASINMGAAPPAPYRSGLSLHRRVFTTLDGLTVLQHTRTSPADLVPGPPSPGSITP